MLALLDALCAAGEHERATGLARAEQDDELLARALDRVHRALLVAGRVDEAGRVLRDAAAEHEKLGPALLLDGSRALREAGHEERGGMLFTEALRTLDDNRPFSAAKQVVRALAAAGAREHMREAVADVSEDSRAFFLRKAVEGLIEAGRLDEADERLTEIPPQDAEWLREHLAAAFVRAGRLDRARALIEGLDGAWRDGPVREYAQALCAAGRLDRATALVEGGGRAGAFAGIGVADALLEAGDRTTALGFLVSAERVLRPRRPGPRRFPSPGWSRLWRASRGRRTPHAPCSGRRSAGVGTRTPGGWFRRWWRRGRGSVRKGWRGAGRRGAFHLTAHGPQGPS